MESLITPLLMTYLNKYIKNFNPGDLKLSLWGGDVALKNLDLQLDVLERDLQLPVSLLSGRIHELIIHIPWTSLGSEPVVLTINTIELALALKTTDFSSRVPTTDDTGTEEKDAPMTAAPPTEGYMQGLLARIKNNVAIKVNNLVLKYTDESTAFSINIGTAETYSTDAIWNPAFADVMAPNFLLHKLCRITDLTVCLDRMDSAGQIDAYQDPLLYRCSVDFRLRFTFHSPTAMFPSLAQFHVRCESLDLSLSCFQAPVLLHRLQRFVQACAPSPFARHRRRLLSRQRLLRAGLPAAVMPSNPAAARCEARPRSPPLYASTTVPSSLASPARGGSWRSWAWQMVTGDDDSEVTARQRQAAAMAAGKSMFELGIYIQSCSLRLTTSTNVTKQAFFSNRTHQFRPLMVVRGYGLKLHLISSLASGVLLNASTQSVQLTHPDAEGCPAIHCGLAAGSEDIEACLQGSLFQTDRLYATVASPLRPAQERATAVGLEALKFTYSAPPGPAGYDTRKTTVVVGPLTAYVGAHILHNASTFYTTARSHYLDMAPVSLPPTPSPTPHYRGEQASEESFSRIAACTGWAHVQVTLGPIRFGLRLGLAAGLLDPIFACHVNQVDIQTKYPTQAQELLLDMQLPAATSPWQPVELPDPLLKHVYGTALITVSDLHLGFDTAAVGHQAGVLASSLMAPVSMALYARQSILPLAFHDCSPCWQLTSDLDRLSLSLTPPQAQLLALTAAHVTAWWQLSDSRPATSRLSQATRAWQRLCDPACSNLQLNLYGLTLEATQTASATALAFALARADAVLDSDVVVTGPVPIPRLVQGSLAPAASVLLDPVPALLALALQVPRVSDLHAHDILLLNTAGVAVCIDEHMAAWCAELPTSLFWGDRASVDSGTLANIPTPASVWMSRLERAVLQANIDTVLVLLPTTPVSRPPGSNVLDSFLGHNVPGTLMIFLPCIDVRAAYTVPVLPLSTPIPIPTDAFVTVTKTLPWRLKAANLVATCICPAAIATIFAVPTLDIIVADSPASEAPGAAAVCAHVNVSPVIVDVAQNHAEIMAAVWRPWAARLSRSASEDPHSDTQSLASEMTRLLSSEAAVDEVLVAGPTFNPPTVLLTGVSLWIQCTLPKVDLRFVSHDLTQSVTAEIEEASCSVDWQEGTLLANLKVAGFQITQQTDAGTSSGSVPAATLSARKTAVLFKSNPRGAPLPGIATERRCFLSVAYEQRLGQGELRLSVQSFDAVVWGPTLVMIMDILHTLRQVVADDHDSPPLRSGKEDVCVTRRRLVPPRKAAFCPLLHMEVGRFRLFMPNSLDPLADTGDDMIVVQVGGVHLSPDVSAETSRRARESAAGSLDALETSSRASLTLSELPTNLQLSVIVVDLSACTAPRSQLFSVVCALSLESQDNPALQWNRSGRDDRVQRPAVLVTPLSVQMVLVPATAGHAHHVADVSVAGELQGFVSDIQLQVLMRAFRDNLSTVLAAAAPAPLPGAAHQLRKPQHQTELVVALTSVSLTLLEADGIALTPLLHLTVLQPILQLGITTSILTCSNVEIHAGSLERHEGCLWAPDLVTPASAFKVAFPLSMLRTQRPRVACHSVNIFALHCEQTMHATVLNMEVNGTLHWTLQVNFVRRMLELAAKLSPLWTGLSADRGPPGLLSAHTSERRLSLKTRTIALQLHTSPKHSLSLRLHQLTWQSLRRAGAGEQIGHVEVSDIYCAASLGDARHTFLDPVNIDCTYDIVPRKGLESLQAIKLHANSVSCKVGPAHVVGLVQLLEELSPLWRQVCGPTNGRQAQPLLRASSPRVSYDDLRTGLFSYVHVSENDDQRTGHPAPQQMVISNTALTWTYPAARMVLEVTALPVPLTLEGEVDTELECELSYWNALTMAYVPVLVFAVTQDQVVTRTVLNSCAPATEWRVRVCQGPAVPLLLAGSLIITSASPLEERTLSLGVTVDQLVLELANHRQDCCLDHAAWASPVLDHYRANTPTALPVAQLNMRSIGLAFGLTGGHATAEASISVLDMDALTWQPLVEACSLDLRYRACPHPLGLWPWRLSLNLADTLRLRLKESVLYLARQTVHSWMHIMTQPCRERATRVLLLGRSEGTNADLTSQEADTPFPREVDCKSQQALSSAGARVARLPQRIVPWFGALLVENATNLPLLFGQIGTEEQHCLPPGCAASYSWGTSQGTGGVRRLRVAVDQKDTLCWESIGPLLPGLAQPLKLVSGGQTLAAMLDVSLDGRWGQRPQLVVQSPVTIKSHLQAEVQIQVLMDHGQPPCVLQVPGNEERPVPVLTGQGIVPLLRFRLDSTSDWSTTWSDMAGTAAVAAPVPIAGLWIETSKPSKGQVVLQLWPALSVRNLTHCPLEISLSAADGSMTSVVLSCTAAETQLMCALPTSVLQLSCRRLGGLWSTSAVPVAQQGPPSVRRRLVLDGDTMIQVTVARCSLGAGLLVELHPVVLVHNDTSFSLHVSPVTTQPLVPGERRPLLALSEFRVGLQTERDSISWSPAVTLAAVAGMGTDGQVLRCATPALECTVQALEDGLVRVGHRFCLINQTTHTVQLRQTISTGSPPVQISSGECFVVGTGFVFGADGVLAPLELSLAGAAWGWSRAVQVADLKLRLGRAVPCHNGLSFPMTLSQHHREGTVYIVLAVDTTPRYLVDNQCCEETAVVTYDGRKTVVLPGTGIHLYSDTLDVGDIDAFDPQPSELEPRLEGHLLFGTRRPAVLQQILGPFWCQWQQHAGTRRATLTNKHRRPALPPQPCEHKTCSAFEIVLGIPHLEVELVIDGDVTRPARPVLGLTLQQVRVTASRGYQPDEYFDHATELDLQLTVGLVQLDNLLTDQAYDFRVMLFSTPLLKPRGDEQFIVARLVLAPGWVKDVHLSCGPLVAQIEDTFLLDTTLMTALGRMFTAQGATIDPATLQLRSAGSSAAIVEQVVQPTLYIDHIVDGAPIHFDEVEVHHVFSYPKLHLFEVLGSRYISEGVLRVGWILGSLGILGSPMALARRLRAGVRDLIMLPYEGIALGPTAFLSGVGSGASSFLRHISAGALTSVANVANSIGRNVERLSMDRNRVRYRDISRGEGAAPLGLRAGMAQGALGLGFSVLSAVAGLVDQPMQTILEADGLTASGLAAGVGRGMLGAVTKPVGGAMELLYSTSQGLLDSAGLVDTPPPRMTAARPHESASGIMQIAALLGRVTEVVVVLEARTELEGRDVDCVLLLTQSALLVVDTAFKTIKEVYKLSDVGGVSCDRADPNVLLLHMADDHEAQTVEVDPLARLWRKDTDDLDSRRSMGRVGGSFLVHADQKARFLGYLRLWAGDGW